MLTICGVPNAETGFAKLEDATIIATESKTFQRIFLFMAFSLSPLFITEVISRSQNIFLHFPIFIIQQIPQKKTIQYFSHRTQSRTEGM